LIDPFLQLQPLPMPTTNPATLLLPPPPPTHTHTQWLAGKHIGGSDDTVQGVGSGMFAAVEAGAAVVAAVDAGRLDAVGAAAAAAPPCLPPPTTLPPHGTLRVWPLSHADPPPVPPAPVTCNPGGLDPGLCECKSDDGLACTVFGLDQIAANKKCI
jgi:hypothetical protein